MTMRFINRALSNRGSRRRVRGLRPREHWSPEMTIAVATLLAVLVFVLYRALS